MEPYTSFPCFMEDGCLLTTRIRWMRAWAIQICDECFWVVLYCPVGLFQDAHRALSSTFSCAHCIVWWTGGTYTMMEKDDYTRKNAQRSLDDSFLLIVWYLFYYSHLIRVNNLKTMTARTGAWNVVKSLEGADFEIIPTNQIPPGDLWTHWKHFGENCTFFQVSIGPFQVV